MSEMDELDKKKMRLQISNDTRKFEIELFWKRSLFFWGFIASAFIAFVASYKTNPTLSLVIANFGLACSIAWTLANRGSKFWQENWEQCVTESEDDVIGPLFEEVKPRLEKDGFWLSARRFSVSKLTIALSDYVMVLWLFINSYLVITILNIEIAILIDNKVLLLTFFTLIWSILTYHFSKGKSVDSKEKWYLFSLDTIPV